MNVCSCLFIKVKGLCQAMEPWFDDYTIFWPREPTCLTSSCALRRLLASCPTNAARPLSSVHRKGSLKMTLLSAPSLSMALDRPSFTFPKKRQVTMD